MERLSAAHRTRERGWHILVRLMTSGADTKDLPLAQLSEAIGRLADC
jgi:hypothetical protein